MIAVEIATQERLSSGQALAVQVAAGQQAFVPAPLPPAPAQLSLVEIAPALMAAERALHDLAVRAAALDPDGLFDGLLARREAVASLRLEGNRATITDLYAYEAGPLPVPGLPAASEGDLRAVLNYERALALVRRRGRLASPGLRLLRELHEELLEGCRGVRAAPGVFRHDLPVSLPLPVLTFAPLPAPPAAELRDALAAFDSYLQEEESAPPLLRAALLTYQFLALHPFPDATPLLARLLPLLALARHEALPHPVPDLSVWLGRRWQTAADALTGVAEQGDWTGWVRFYLRTFEEAARDTAARLERLADVRGRWRAQLADARAAEPLLHLGDSLFAAPFLTFPLAQQRLGGNYRAARTAVQRLVTDGIVQPAAGDAFRKLFVAGEVLQAVED